MLPLIHLIFSLVISIILLLLKWQWWQISLFFLTSVFIDIDHYLIYIIKKKDFNLIKAYKHFLINEKLKKEVEKKLFFLHTIEFLILLLIFTFISYEIFFPLLFGFMIHAILDIIWAIKYKPKKYSKASSIIFYLINK